MQMNTLDARSTLTVSGPAEPAEVARLRAAVGDWVDDVVPVTAERRADILLATDEAMTNCADHAYRDRSGPGSLSVKASYHRGTAGVTVSITDDGAWVEPSAKKTSSLRGRGITLMKALADSVTIDGRRTGTTVCLRFAGCRGGSQRSMN